MPAPPISPSPTTPTLGTRLSFSGTWPTSPVVFRFLGCTLELDKCLDYSSDT